MIKDELKSILEQHRLWDCKIAAKPKQGILSFMERNQ